MHKDIISIHFNYLYVFAYNFENKPINVIAYAFLHNFNEKAYAIKHLFEIFAYALLQKFTIFAYAIIQLELL